MSDEGVRDGAGRAPHGDARAPDAPARGVVLVVDDEPDICESLADLLAGVGFHVVTAGDGAQALSVIERDGRPDAILLDLMMPGMSGWDFLAHRSRSDALLGIPVVVTSAADFSLGPDVVAFMPKPFDPEKLIHVLGALMSR
jgi:CheY-like chemotaxis protein